jgi:cytochrome c-type biogenesis protein CcmH
MILFWVICAGLIVIALAFVLPPLLQVDEKNKQREEINRKEVNIAVYRDQLEELKGDLANGIISQPQFDQDTEDIQRRLLEDISAEQTNAATAKVVKSRATAYAIALAIPVIAVVFYLKVGSLQGISGSPTMASSTDSTRMGSGERSAEQIAANVEKLAEKLKSNPSDAEGWRMLGRSYASMERFGEATGAYAKATELKPNDADLWAEYAFATAMAGNRKVEGKSLELVNRALAVDPDNAKALQLAGTAAFDEKDYKKAIELWQRVLRRAPAGSDLAEAISARIDEAKRLSAAK